MPARLESLEDRYLLTASLAISDATVSEGNSGVSAATFTVSLSEPAPAGGVSVVWSAVAGGTAAASDFQTATNQLLNFDPGETNRTISVNVVGDTFMERNETFQVVLSSPANAVLYDNLGQGTILDEDVEAMVTTATGPLDLSWNDDGYSHFRRGNSPIDRAAGMALDPDGRVLLFGNPLGYPTGVFAVRYLANGSLDASFGSGGVAEVDPPPISILDLGVFGGEVYQTGPNRGKVLIFGSAGAGASFVDTFLVRLNVDGTLDNSFGTNGVVQLEFSGLAERPFDIEIYESGPEAGKLVLVGELLNQLVGRFGLIARFAADGSLDSTFGGDGYLIHRQTYEGAPVDTDFDRVVLGSDGTLLVSGTAGPKGALWRFDGSGNFDATFGTAGVAFSPLNSYSDGINDVVIQPNGRIIQQVRGPNSTIGFAGFTPSGQLDTSFGTSSSGVVAYDADGIARTISVDAAGRLLVTGDNNLDRFYVSRYLENGTPDTTFDTIGHDELISSHMGAYTLNDGALISPDGNILAAGGCCSAGPVGGQMAAAKFETARNELSVTMTAAATAPAGGIVTYTIRVRNTGDDATFASWRIILPNETALMGAVAPPGWELDTSDPHGSGIVSATRKLSETDGEMEFTVTVQLAAGLPTGAVVTSTVEASSAILDHHTANNTATAHVLIAVNEPPIATNDDYPMDEDTTLVVAAAGILGNDFDANANPLTAVWVTGPSQGVLVLNANGSFTYTPNPNFNGTDQFTYRAHDGTSFSNLASVNLQIAPVNDPPVVYRTQSLPVTVDEGSTATASGFWLDVDEGDSVTLSASIGSIQKNLDGTWDWSLDTTDGPDESQTVEIVATDSQNAASSYYFSLQVLNLPPVLTVTINSVSVEEGALATNTGTWLDPGQDPDEVVLEVTYGSITKNDNGTWNWSGPALDGPSMLNVLVTACDDGDCSTTSFDVDVRNVNPQISVDQTALSATEGIEISNTGSWSDPAWSYPAATYDDVDLQVNWGQVTRDVDGTWEWTMLPDDGMPVPLTITITANDGDGGIATTAFEVTISNIPPTVMADQQSVTVLEGSLPSMTGTWSDPGSNDLVSLTASVGDVAPTSDGTWYWSYTPVNGPYSEAVSITARDAAGAETSTTFSLIVLNVAPSVGILGPAFARAGETHSYVFGVTDPGRAGGDTITFPFLSGGLAGTISNWDYNGNLGLGSFDVTFFDDFLRGRIAIQASDSDNAKSNVASIDVCQSSGDLDPTFDSDGINSLNLSDFDRLSASTTDASGRVVAIGSTLTAGIRNDLLVARYKQDGSPDAAFGTAGYIVKQIGTDFQPGAIAMQADGKIVVSGTTFYDESPVLVVARLLEDGNLDASFGTNGVTYLYFGESIYAGAKALAIQSDGSILVGGTRFDFGFGLDFLVVRLTTAGSLDSTFYNDGSREIPGLGENRLTSIALQDDGKILVGGYDSNGVHGSQVYRLHPDGSFDPTFGLPSNVFANTTDSRLYDLKTTSDGEIVVAGSGMVFTGNEFRTMAVLSRLESDGSVDAGFGNQGLVAIDFSNVQSSFDAAQFLGAVVLPDDTIVAVGSANSSSTFAAQIAVAKFDEDGSFHPDFGLAGKKLIQLGEYAFAHGVSIQRDGRILIAAESWPTLSNPDIAVLRLTNCIENPPGVVWGDEGEIERDDEVLVDLAAARYTINGVAHSLAGLSEVTFDGGAGFNAMGIANDFGDVIYEPNPYDRTKGTIRTSRGLTARFVNLSPVDFDNLGSVTVKFPGGNDQILVSPDWNSLATTALEAAGTVPALKVSGTSGGIGFERAHVFRTGRLIIDTTLVDGDDAIVVSGGANGHGVSDLVIRTGTGYDVVSFTGAISVNGMLDLASPLVQLEANIAAATMLVRNGSQVTVNPTSIVSADLTIEVGAHLVLDGRVNGNLHNAGILSGTGRIAGTYDGAGRVRPGHSPGRLTIEGDYLPAAGGVLEIELGGTTAATLYDQLEILGHAAFAGGLHVSLVPGFTPSPGDLFDVVVYGTRTGSFADAQVPDRHHVIYTGSSLQLLTNRAPNIVSSPVTLAREDESYEYNIVAGDLDPSDVLTITAGSLPSWLTLVDHGDGTATLSGQPSQVNAGPHDITLTVRDIFGAEAQQTFVLRVRPDVDFNDDGMVDLLDIDALIAAIAAASHGPAFDLTGEGLVNRADRDAWLSEAGELNLGSGRTYLLGDANLDGYVDGSDFNLWNQNKFTTSAAWSRSDFTADGVVDGADFNIWNMHKFTSSFGGMRPAAGGRDLSSGGMAVVDSRAMISVVATARRRSGVDWPATEPASTREAAVDFAVRDIARFHS